jgi:hypothetical protein
MILKYFDWQQLSIICWQSTNEEDFKCLNLLKWLIQKLNETLIYIFTDNWSVKP